jgi:hypothetical protein
MSAIERLEALLESQREGLSRLLDLCHAERQCLLQGHLQQLEPITREQAELLARQSVLSMHVYTALEQTARALDLPEHAALQDVAARLEAPHGPRVQQLSRALMELAATLQQEGRVNWHLAQQALRYVDFTLKVIGKAKDGPRPYALPSQSVPATAAQLLVDSCA